MERNHAENKDVQEKMLAQVLKTNGRVSALEKWKYTIGGGMVVIITLIGWYVEIHK